MEQNKFDDKVKEQFFSREIEPTERAWDRLDAMLSSLETETETKTETRKSIAIPWFRIAAVFIVFLGAALWFLNSEKKTQPYIEKNNSIVNASNDQQKDSAQIEVIPQEKINNHFKSANNTVAAVVVRKEIEKVESESVKEKLITQKLEKNKEEIVVNQFETKEPKEQIVLNEVKNTQEAKEEFVKPQLKVDANALLEQVENEEKITFRQKVIKTIKKGYQDTKVAFVNRNRESSKNNQ